MAECRQMNYTLHGTVENRFKGKRSISPVRKHVVAEQKPKIIIVAGPTAAGKTDVGIRLAERFHGEIVSADSVQVYRYMDVGSAKPSREEQAIVPHHMIDIRTPDESYSAGEYVRDARKIIQDIVERGRVPLVVGGTGLYIRLLRAGMADLPSADENLRNALRESEQNEPGSLFTKLSAIDPQTALKTGPRNLTRIVRALEIYEITGKKMSQIYEEHAFRDMPYTFLYLGLTPERSQLYERIDNRVDSMIEGGLLDETETLYELGYGRELKSMQSLGYRHAGMILAGEMHLEAATDLLKRDTRHFAKRQFTWFRSEPDVLWFDPREIKGIGCVVTNFLGA